MNDSTKTPIVKNICYGAYYVSGAAISAVTVYGIFKSYIMADQIYDIIDDYEEDYICVLPTLGLIVYYIYVQFKEMGYYDQLPSYQAIAETIGKLHPDVVCDFDY